MSSSAHSIKDHITPFRVYYGVAAALLVLTFLTVYVAGIDFGPWNMVVAMIIAVVKASLVCLFFMHLLYDNKMYAITFLSAILFLAIFVIFTMFDALNRDDIYEIRNQPVKAHATALYDENGVLLKSGSTHDDETTGAAEAAEAAPTAPEKAPVDEHPAESGS